MTREEARSYIIRHCNPGYPQGKTEWECAINMAIEALSGESSDDLISRQAAIDALKEHRALFCDNTPDTFSKLSYAEKSRVDELDMAIATLINLPSAQQDCTDCPDYDTERHFCPRYCKTIRRTLEEAQPERTGRWINDHCSECGAVCRDIRDKWCYGCGARMEEPEDIPMEYFESGGR